MPAFVTLEQYREWSGDDEAELTARQIQSASRLVERAIRGSVFTVADGLPVDTGIRTALQNATSAVLAFRHPTEDESAAGELSAAARAGLKRVSLGNATYEVDAAAAAAGARDEPGDYELPAEAFDILDEAGLISRAVYVYG